MRNDTNTATKIFEPLPTAPAAERHDEGRPVSLVGPSAAAHAMRDALKALSRIDTPVLLCGAPGAGKRDFAEELHRGGARRGEAFRVLDFTAPGGERMTAPRGNGAGRPIGTAYVPAVDTLSHVQQMALADLINTPGRTMRVIVGTTADVDHLFLIGHLRPDLARLLTVRVTLPSLRDRMEDVAAIAERCVGRWSQATGTTRPVITASATAELREYCWPRNVRELEEVIATACTRAHGRAITAAAISAALGRRAGRHAGEDVVPLREIERNYILAALARCGDNQSLAARRLGIGRGTLFRKLQELSVAFEQQPRRSATGVA